VLNSKLNQRLVAPAKTVAKLDVKTLSDIASRTGLSKMTVSRVMRGEGSFSVKAKEKVQKAVRETGYVHNRLAGSLATQKSSLVAVIVPTIGNIVFTEVLAGISQVLTPAGLQPVLAVTDYDLEREDALVETMLSWRPQGVIIAGLEHTPLTRKRLKRSGIAIIEVMDIDGSPIDCAVGFSHSEAGQIIARHFVKQGYRRIAYAGTDLTYDVRAAKRFKGFVKELSVHGLHLTADVMTPLPTSLEAGENALRKLMESAADIDAVYFSNDDMAVGALQYCLRNAIAVPEAMALAGFNGLGIGQGMPIALTSIRSPRVETGIRSAELLLDRLAGKGVPRTVNLGLQFLAGQSS
jgi:LacI family transcriptional regulator, gluconate utilization system Gnt-I transcriptional repressor